MKLLKILVKIALLSCSKRPGDFSADFRPQPKRTKHPTIFNAANCNLQNMQNESEKITFNSADSNVNLVLFKDINSIQSSKDRKNILQIIEHNDRDENFLISLPNTFLTQSDASIIFSKNDVIMDADVIKSEDLPLFLLDNEEESILSEIDLEAVREDILLKTNPVISDNTLKIIDLIKNGKILKKIL